MTEKKEWIHDFFGGSRDLYGIAHTAIGTFERKNTEKEVDGVLKILDAKPGNHILDWCGGWGRHSVPLAKRGYKVTLLDMSEEYLKRAEAHAKRERVSIDLVHKDFRETPKYIQADYAVNLFTAGIGYLGEENDVVALSSLRSSLKPDARILIDTMNLFWLARNFIPNSWFESADGTKRLLERRQFDVWTNTVHTTLTFHNRKTGEETLSKLYNRVYSPDDLSRVLKTAGFVPFELYGDLDASAFGFNSHRIVMTARAS